MKCRHCASELKLCMLDLGTAPPSNAFLNQDQLRAPEVWYPLRILVCEHCWLVQTEDYAGREALFTDDYVYFSSYSTSWLAHARDSVAKFTARYGLDAQSLVVEVAANDGYLLQYFQDLGIPSLGIEPTASTASVARAKGLEIIERFFGMELAAELVLEDRRADLIIGNNVLAHVPDINDFLSGAAQLLKPEGRACFEFPHLQQLVALNQFDTVYHEHFSYLSLTAVHRICQANGLKLTDVECLSTHGGSLRIHAARSDSADVPVSERVQALLDEEAALGMTTAAYYTRVQGRAEEAAHALLRFLLDCRTEDKRVAAYGAAAKGNTLLNFAGVRSDLLSFVVDRNPAKQGRYLPGSRIPVLPEAALLEQRPEVILVLPWNLEPEVVKQLAYCQEWHAALWVAIPELRRCSS